MASEDQVVAGSAKQPQAPRRCWKAAPDKATVAVHAELSEPARVVTTPAIPQLSPTPATRAPAVGGSSLADG